MKHWILQIKLGLVVFASALLIPCLVMGNAEETKNSEESVAAETKAGTKAQESAKVSTGTVLSAEKKTESVHVKALADGTPETVTVDVTLKNPGETEKIRDKTDLKDIKNTQGDEEYELSPDGTLLWDNHGEDISYKGTSAAKLPVNVKVTYTLDGKELQPEELAGKSGHLNIRFTYENHTSQTVVKEGKRIPVKVPFVMLSALVLDEETASNIQVENGKVVEMDGQNVVIGYAVPGLGDSLKLTEFEPTEDIKIPEYVEVDADVTDFSLDFTATIASTGLFYELDTDKLSDVDDLTGAMDDLNEASGKLVDGMSELFDGVSVFDDSMGEYLKGVKAIDEGVKTFNTALGQIDAQKEALQTGAKTLADSLSTINSSIQKLPSEEDVQSDEDMLKAVQAAKTLSEDAKKLLAVIESIKDSMSRAKTFADTVTAYKEQEESTAKTTEEDIRKARKLLEDVEAEVSVDKDSVTVHTEKVSEAVGKAAKETARREARDKGLSEAEADAVAAAAAKAAEEAVKNSDVVIDVPDTAVKTKVKGKEEALQKLDEARKHLDAMPVLDIPDIDLQTGEVDSVLTDMQTQLQVLKSYADAISGGGASLQKLEEALKELKQNSSALSAGSSQLSEGITALTEGISQLYSGSGQLKKGTSALASAGPSISKGLSALKEGAKALRDGMQTFDEEGIQELTDLAGDDLAGLMDRVKALKDADVAYTSYSGLAEGSTGEVRFVIETDAVERK